MPKGTAVKNWAASLLPFQFFRPLPNPSPAEGVAKAPLPVSGSQAARGNEKTKPD